MLNIDQVNHMFQHWSSFGWVQHTSLLMFHLSSSLTICSFVFSMSLNQKPFVCTSYEKETMSCQCWQPNFEALFSKDKKKKSPNLSLCQSVPWHIQFTLNCSAPWLPPKARLQLSFFSHCGLPQLNSDFFGGGVISRRLYNRRLTADWQKWSLVWLKTALTGVCSIY